MAKPAYVNYIYKKFIWLNPTSVKLKTVPTKMRRQCSGSRVSWSLFVVVKG